MILSNVPSLSYIRWVNLLVIYQGVTYQILNDHTCKPYIYWDVSNPNQLTTSNVKLDEKSGRYYIIFNQKGTYTIVPNSDIEVDFSENPSRDAITSKVLGISGEVENHSQQFTAVQLDIDGIKTSVGQIESDLDSTKTQISTIEQRADEIDLSVKSIEKQYSDDEAMRQLRDDINDSLLSLQSTLGLFSYDMNTYMEDNKLSDEEMNGITAYKTLVNENKEELNTQLDKVIQYYTDLGDTEKVTKLNTAKSELNTSVSNLISTIDTACIDKTFTNAEITSIINGFGNANTEINECNNLIDSYILLGIGGSLVEEISKITLKQNEISLNVSSVESSINGDGGVIDRLNEAELKITDDAIINTVSGTFYSKTEVDEKIQGVDIGLVVKNVDVMYYLSTSATELVGGSWSTTAPTWENGKYIWSKTVSSYTDGTSSETTPVCITGAKGEDGTEIVSITEEYYLSTSKTTQTGGSWSTTFPTWESGKYIWTRSKIVYANPSSTQYTTPVCDTTWEGLQSQIDSNKIEIETTKNTVAEHTISLDNITSRVSSVETSTTTINGNIVDLQSRMNTAENKITDDSIINTVSSVYATKSSVEELDSKLIQTATSIEMSFLESGGLNRIENSAFLNGTNNWSSLSWNNIGGSGGSTNFYVITPLDEWCLTNRNILRAGAYDLTTYTGETLGVGFDSTTHIWGGTNWTLQCLLACHRCTGIMIEILEFDSDGNKLDNFNRYWYDNIGWGGQDRNNWTKITQQFTLINSNCSYFTVRFFMGAWTGEETSAYMWVAEPMMTSGHHSDLLYTPSSEELYSGITKIDKNGITVSNSNANTTTSMTADGFYINQSGSGDIFKVDSNGISLSQGIVTLNKEGLTINSPNHNVQTYIDANGLNVTQNGLSAIKVHSNGLEIAQGNVVLNQYGLWVNHPNGGVSSIFGANGVYIQKDGTSVLSIDTNGISICQGITTVNQYGIRINHSDGTYTQMEASGLMHYNGTTGRQYHYLVYAGAYTCLSEETVTIQLPDEFKGKYFKIITAIKRIYVDNNDDIQNANYPLLSFYAESLNEDYENGTFQVYASVRAWNRNSIGSYGTVIGDNDGTEKELLKPVVAYWAFV